MKIACVGNDVAGLAAALLLKRQDPSRIVRIVAGGERSSPLPVEIFANPIVAEPAIPDRELSAALEALVRRAPNVLVSAPGRETRTDHHPYSFIDVPGLTQQLGRLAALAGCQRGGDGDIADADLVLIADGAESIERQSRAETFGTVVTPGGNRHALFRLERDLEFPLVVFKPTEHGVFQAFVHPRVGGGAALIVEAPARVIAASSLGTDAASLDLIASLFAAELDGARPVAVETRGWRPSLTVRNRRWHAGNRVLMGAAAYTTHFSVGLAARSALLDAVGLAELMAAGSPIERVLADYDARRRPHAESLQRASDASLGWLERVDRYIDMDPAQFAFSYLTRSMRITHTRQASATSAGADPQAPVGNAPPPPIMTPFKLRGLTFANRIALSPMCMYSATDGLVNDFHLVHLGSRAMGGAGLIFTEMTDVSADGRISLKCAGMYRPEHVGAWKRIVDFVHQASASRIAIQLAHAGAKGSLSPSFEGHVPLPDGERWELLAPSPMPFTKGRQVPREATRADMERVRDDFVQAAEMSNEAGFDMLELHFAHGYLMSAFISPLQNKRRDDYGGPLAKRMRFPLEVLAAVRRAWPAEKPISVRISASDWAEGGNTIEDAIEISRMLHGAGCDILAVSAGGTSYERPATRILGRLYQTGFADQIRNALKVPTMAVGAISSVGDANTIIAAGRADMCLMARGLLFDPYFARHAAHKLQHPWKWPRPYHAADKLRLREG